MTSETLAVRPPADITSISGGHSSSVSAANVAVDADTFPEVGEVLGDFSLLSVLGSGAHGRVFLAIQPSLADRPVVLKVTPRRGQEHLSLARLQHPHIMPLYEVQDHPDRDLRVLCMPYLGGTTLAELLLAVDDTPPHERLGKHLLDVLLGQDLPEAPTAKAVRGPAWTFLARASYVQATCWIGACLADALHYAHERGLVHLDLKPSNVLLAADGQPMLLDFHLARGPIQPDCPMSLRLGGTPAYMSPEQWTATIAAHGGRALSVAVDGRSDIYSLGVLLYQMLAGRLPSGVGGFAVRLRRDNPSVSVGLADLIGKCLAPDPKDRYPEAESLAADLRRHLSDLPLRGVLNRSPSERWRKWRRRRPDFLTRVGATSAMLAVILAGASIAGERVRQRRHEAEASLIQGRHALGRQDYPEAVSILERGLSLTEGLIGAQDLRPALAGQVRRARRAQAADGLHRLADRIRLLYVVDPLPPGAMSGLEDRCARVWATRGRILDSADAPLESEIERRIRTDLLDLVILWADLRVRLAPGPAREQARREALRLLEDAEGMSGPSSVLEAARREIAGPLGRADLARTASRGAAGLPPGTAWEHCALGRSLLRSGDLAAAAEEFERAVDRQPKDLWSHFYRGVCAYRLRRHEDAVNAFSICVALAPETPECYYNRAKARERLGQSERALRDYDHALELAPTSAAFALDRGLLHYNEGRLDEAADDLQRARAHGADPATIRHHLALVDLARKDYASAPGQPAAPSAARSGPRGGPQP